MCGISGFYFYNPQKADTKTLIINALIKHEIRGSDASGIALYLNDGRVYLRKLPIPASKFAQYLMKIPIAWDRVKIALIHTRAATCGSPLDNENNHPLYYVNGRIYSLVHNGSIYSDERIREVDSDALLTPIRKANKLNIAIALKMAELPGVKNFIVTDGERLYAYADTFLNIKHAKYYTQFHQAEGRRIPSGLYVVSQHQYSYVKNIASKTQRQATCYSITFNRREIDVEDIWLNLFAADLAGHVTYFTKNIHPPKIITADAQKIKRQLIRVIKEYNSPTTTAFPTTAYYYGGRFAWDSFIY